MKFPSVGLDSFSLQGGLDQITPTAGLKPGVCKNSLNFECSTTGGYGRIAGYERYDGRASPSDAIYSVVYVTEFLNTPTVGQTLTGATSGATGEIIAVRGDGVCITKRLLTFTVGETVRVGATDIGVMTNSPGPVTRKLNAQYLAAAADAYRADIEAPPGAGPARGGFLYEDELYVFRDNALETATILHRATATGWEVVPFYYEVSFTAGTNEPAEGDTLTQGGVTALIKRVVSESSFDAATGAWSPGAAAGRFIIAAPTGGDFAAGAATAGGSTTVTLSGAQTAISFSRGGKFECIKTNFSGGLGTFRVYGCDGVNRAWEFDGDILVPISTGNGVNDKPKHIYEHREALFLSIESSVFKSAPGWPYCYTSINGGAEFAIGDEVTGLIYAPGTQTSAALFIFGLRSQAILYGTDSSDFNLVAFDKGFGANHYSVNNMADTIGMDDRGVAMLTASQNYGNFDSARLTNTITKFIDARRTRFSCSTLSRSKSQYRAFFTDGYGLYLTIVNGKHIGSMPVRFPNPIYNAIEDKYSNGAEACFYFGTEGYVYQADKGTSFDGASINSLIKLNYSNGGNSRVLKSYRRAAIEVQGAGYAEFQFGYSLGYGKSDISQPDTATYESNLSSVYWDSFTWDNFYWDGVSMLPAECSMTGTAENVALAIYCNGNYFKPFIVNTAIIHYIPRRLIR